MSMPTPIRYLLLPFSWLYRLGVWVRNALFNLEILTSQTYDLPIISVGNLTVGGTGKTPMTEYLIKLLAPHYQVAMLSRGYKRLTKGQRLATPESGPDEIGDEPTQVLRKYPSTTVVVDANRRQGLETLSKLTHPRVDVVVMDDAFQHRFVLPGLSILLMDYHRPIHEDFLLPAGNLREPVSQAKRADILVFTKCPPDLSPIDRRLMVMKLNLQSHQTAYFTTMVQEPFQPVLPQGVNDNLQRPLAERPVLIIAGIANPSPFVSYVRRLLRADTPALVFPDHHRFTEKDMARIKASFEPIKAQGGVMVTTEKDAIRLTADKRFEDLCPYLYTAPITLRFLDDEEATFHKIILDYVRNNKRHGIMDPATHAQPS